MVTGKRMHHVFNSLGAGAAGSAGSVWWGGALKCPGRGPCMRWEVEVKPEAGATMSSRGSRSIDFRGF